MDVRSQQVGHIKIDSSLTVGGIIFESMLGGDRSVKKMNSEQQESEGKEERRSNPLSPLRRITSLWRAILGWAHAAIRKKSAMG